MKMANTIKLSDMLMMQMVGGLEEFANHANSNTLPKNYVEQVQSSATIPTIFRDIVRKTITTQFGNPLTSLRELGQNARDAYNENENEKTIEFLVKERDGRQFVSARDYGIGMSPNEVFTMFLVPYNSGKEFDPEKIGEHGIGFFSNFDISDQMNVRTRNGSGLTTTLSMQKQEEDWGIDYKLTDKDFKGTEIEMRLSKSVPEIDIYQTLVKNLGFLNSGFVITYNGDKLNQLPEFYEEIGSAEVANVDRKGQLKLGFAGKNLRENPFFGRADHPSNLVMTQNGLYIKEPSVSELIEDEVLEDLVNRMVDLGYNFWLELPNNVGLTKGRNNIVSRDFQNVTHSATEAFSQGVLEKILEDENLVYEMDTQLADVVDRVLGLKVNQKTFNWRKLGSALNNFYHLLKDTEIDVSFKNLRFNFQVSDRKNNNVVTDNDPDPNSARKRRYAKAFSYGEIAGFSGDLIRKKIIPAKQYGDVEIPTKVNVLNLIGHYCDGTLYTSELLTELGLEPHLDSQVLEKNDGKSLAIDLKEIWSGGKKGLLGFGASLGSSMYAFGSSLGRLFESDEETKYDFRRTKREYFEQMVEKNKVGQEYVTLFDNLGYVDHLISEANETTQAKIRLFGKQEGWKNETAHTNRFSMGFNVYDRTVQKYLDSIRAGEYTEGDTRSLVELVIHEKAHDAMGLFNVSWDHGKEFYNKTKKELRENLYDYCRREKIDPYQGINAELKPVETERLSPQRLKVLIK
jgi:hypothetical protein